MRFLKCMLQFKFLVIFLIALCLTFVGCFNKCTSSTITYNLRDTGPAGGLIFHIVDNEDGTKTYYEAAPNTWNGGIFDPRILWQDYPERLIGEGAQGTAIGAGKSNTARIVTWLNDNGQTGRAAQVVDSLEFGGYNDWFLPSKDELNEMHVNLYQEESGGFADSFYWSSSEYDAGGAWGQVFTDDGFQHPGMIKYIAFPVRPVRAF